MVAPPQHRAGHDALCIGPVYIMNNAHINQLMHTLKFEYVSIPFSLCNIKLKRNLNELSDFVKAFNPPSERFFKNAPLLIQLYNMCL